MKRRTTPSPSTYHRRTKRRTICSNRRTTLTSIPGWCSTTLSGPTWVRNQVKRPGETVEALT